MMHYITSIKLVLIKNYPNRRNIYRIFLTKCLSLKLMKIKPSMDNDKSPGNYGRTKEFYIKFWDVVKEPLCASIQ